MNDWKHCRLHAETIRSAPRAVCVAGKTQAILLTKWLKCCFLSSLHPIQEQDSNKLRTFMLKTDSMTRLSYHGWNCLVPAQHLGTTNFNELLLKTSKIQTTYVDVKMVVSRSNRFTLSPVEMNKWDNVAAVSIVSFSFVTCRLSKSISLIHSHEFRNGYVLRLVYSLVELKTTFVQDVKVWNFFVLWTNVDYLPLLMMGRIQRVCSNKKTFPACGWTV